MASLSVLPPATSNQAGKLFKDSWNSSPPQVTSYLTYPRTAFTGPSVTYTSPNCGFGWRFQIEETHEQVGAPYAHVQDIERKVDVTFHPHMCSSMPLSTVRVNVKVSFPLGDARSTQETEFTDISLKCNQSIGSYTAPPQCEGQVDIEITLTFSDSDGLSFPTTSPPNAAAALQQSLDASSFVDSKFYLFSAKARGRPTRPRAVYAKSTLLTDRSPYLRDLISSKMDDKHSTPCDLREDVPDEVKKLDGGDFDYEDDSDLEDDTDEFDEVVTSKTKTSNLKSRSPLTAVVNGEVNERQCKSPDHFQDGRAYAINGTAYKTWKAFIYHTYTNEIHFNELKSQQSQASPRVSSTNAVSCSPKSMYRFAESANIPHLKSMAKASILRGLSQRNIITELFSVFTSRYKEIIELEVEFLLKNFTEDVADRFDDVLQTIVSGGAPHCFRVLAFTLRRLRGASTKIAWGALRRHAAKSTRISRGEASGSLLLVPTIQQGKKRIASAEAEEVERQRIAAAEAEEAERQRVAAEAEAAAAEAWRLANEEQERLVIEKKRLEREEHDRLLKEEEEELARAIAELETEAAEAEAQKEAEETEARAKEAEVKAKEEKEREEKARKEKEAKAAAALNKVPVKGRKGGKKKGAMLNLWGDEEAKETERMEQEKREAEERAVNERAEREAKEKAEQEAKERAEREAREQAEEEERKAEERKAEARKAEEAKKAEEEAIAQAEKEAAEKAIQETEDWGFTFTKPRKGKKGKGVRTSPLDFPRVDEEDAKAEEERLAREKAEQEAREKEERERAKREEEERANREREEQERAEKEKEATAEGGGSNSIFNFGGTGWGSSGGFGGSWSGFGSWGENAKSRAPNTKNAIGSAWGSQTFSGFGFGGGDEDFELSPEELKLIDVGGEPPSSFADNLHNPPATEHAGDAGAPHGPPPVPNKTLSQTPSKAHSRVPFKAPSPAPLPAPPIEPAIVETVEASPNANADTPTAPFTSEDEWEIPVKRRNGKKRAEARTSGTPAVGGAKAPDIPPAEEPWSSRSSQAIPWQHPAYKGTFRGPLTATEAAKPSLNPRTAEDPTILSPVSSGHSSLADIPSEIKERNKQAIIVRANIHELTKKVEELKDERLKVQELDPSGDEIALKEQEIQKTKRSLRSLKRRAEQLHRAAVESTGQLAIPKTLSLNFKKSSPEDAALRLEDTLGLMFGPERKSFRLEILLPQGDPRKCVKAEVQKVLSEYGIKSIPNISNLYISILFKTYVDLITGFRQSHYEIGS